MSTAGASSCTSTGKGAFFCRLRHMLPAPRLPLLATRRRDLRRCSALLTCLWVAPSCVLISSNARGVSSLSSATIRSSMPSIFPPPLESFVDADCPRARVPAGNGEHAPLLGAPGGDVPEGLCSEADD